jgi:hypothetical protein
MNPIGLWATMGRVYRGCCGIVHHYNVALRVTNLIVYGSHDERTNGIQRRRSFGLIP